MLPTDMRREIEKVFAFLHEQAAKIIADGQAYSQMLFEIGLAPDSVPDRLKLAIGSGSVDGIGFEELTRLISDLLGDQNILFVAHAAEAWVTSTSVVDGAPQADCDNSERKEAIVLTFIGREVKATSVNYIKRDPSRLEKGELIFEGGDTRLDGVIGGLDIDSSNLASAK